MKRNATLFRLPEAVANDGKGQRSIRKRPDCLCQTFSCATPCRAVFGGSEGIRPTSLAAVSAVKRNATSFRLPETVANDGKGQRSIRKRLDCLCQTFSCATPCRAVFGGSEGIRPTSLSAVSVVKRNATSFRLPEAVDVQRIPSGKATNKKRHDRFCQALFLVAQPLTGARNWRKRRDSSVRALRR